MKYAKAIIPPVLLFGISLIFTLLYSLQSPYIIGSDTIYEYQILIQTIINNGRLVTDLRVLNSCISVNWLPYTIWNITGWNTLHIFKYLYPIIASFVPVVMYYISRTYLNRPLSFVAALMVFTCVCHIWAASYVRNTTGLLLFALAVLVIARNVKFKNWIVTVLFAMAMIDYYAIGLMIIVLIYIQYITSCYTKQETIVTTGNLLILMAVMFYWYAWVNPHIMYDLFRTAFAGIKSGEININVMDMLISIKYIILLLISSAIIGLGYWYNRNKYGNHFKSLIVAAILLMVVAVVTPDFEVLYGVGRLQYMLIPIMAVPFIQGIHKIASCNKYINYATWPSMVITILFVAWRFLPADPSNLYPYP